MTVFDRAPALLVPLALAAALMLTGCASAAHPTASGAANSPETAQAFADCLTDEGVEGVFVNDDGYVGVQFTASSGDGDTPGGDTPDARTPGGTAAGDAGTAGSGPITLDAGDGSANTAAEERCTAQVPDYRTEVFDLDPAQAAEALSQSRAFAACARQNGLAEFPDPDAASGGKLMVPEGTTEAAFLGVVTVCASTFAPSNEADAPVDAGGDAGIRYSLVTPEFGGAYTKEWEAEVTAAFFDALEPAQQGRP